MKLRPLLPWFCITVLLSTAALTAQPEPRPPAGEARDQRPARQGPVLERLQQALDELNLSDEQRTSIDKILEEARQELRKSMEEVREMEPQQRREHIRQHMSQVHQEVMAQLDEQQQAKLRARLEQFRGPGFGRGPGPGAGPDAAADEPMPPPPPPGVGPDRPVLEMLRRMRESLDQLELTEEQKKQVQETFDETRKKLNELRQQAEQDMRQLREETRELVESAREQMQNLLTPEQQQRLRELMEEARRNMPGARQEPPPPPAEMEPGERQRPPRNSRELRDPEQRREEMQQRRQLRRQEAPARPAPPPPPPSPEASAPADTPAPAPPAVGEAAPDFTLQKLNGRPLQLSSFRGRPVVVVFGSYTCPHFRQRSSQLEDLRRSYGTRAVFLMVYAKEAHPANEWELSRNRQQKIAIPQHADLEERRAVAQRARDALGLKMEIVLDTMDQSTAAAYGAGPSSAFVIGRNGTLMTAQKWLDPWGLRQWIDQAIEQPATQPASSAGA